MISKLQFPLYLAAFLAASATFSSAASPTLSVVRVWSPLSPELAGLSDMDGDGREELIVRELQRTSVEILRPDASDQRGYKAVGRISGSTPIEWVRALDLDGDGTLELCVRYINAGFRILDGATLAERRVLSDEVTDIDVGDVNGDQLPEVVVRESSKFLFLDPHSLEARASIPAPYGESFELGDVVGDAREEIVLQEGLALQVDGTDQAPNVTTVWTNTNTPLERFVLTDVDSDGKAEIVNSSYFGGVGIHRVTPAHGYTQIAAYDISYAAWFGDVDDNGSLDVVTAAAVGHGAIIAIDLAGTELWRVARIFGRNPTTLAIANIDAPGSKALVWNSTESLNVEPLPGRSGTPWQTLNPEGLRASTFLPSAQGSTLLALLTTGVRTGQRIQTVALLGGSDMSDAGGSSDAWMASPLMYPRTTYQGAIVEIQNQAAPSEAYALLGAEHSVNDASDFTARIWIMDRSSKLLRTVDIPSSPRIGAARRFMMPGESQPHVVALDRPVVGGATLIVVGVNDGAIRWRSTPLAVGFRAFDPIVVEDLDADGSPEVVIVSEGEALVFDPSMGPEPIARHALVLAATTNPSRPGASPELLLSRSGGAIDVYPGLSSTPSRSLDLSYDAYEMVAFVEPATARSVLVSVDDSRVHAHDLASGEPIPTTYIPGGYFPSSRLDVADVDGDGNMEVSVAGQSQVVLRLSISGIFGDGFER
jgi:hypothetical protein